MHLFYVKNMVSDSCSFDKEEAKHCRVLRLKPGDTVYITEGKGNMHEAELLVVDAVQTSAKIVSTTHDYQKRPYYLHVAIAPTKNTDRIEWFVEKATEIGIDEISPIICERSEKYRLKPERLEKIALSAMKQSLSAWLPKINPPLPFRQIIASAREEQKFIAWCNQAETRHLKSVCQPNKTALILIGPEGDFTEQEVALALQHNFMAISLGNARLRTETAGMVACTLVNLVNSE